MKSDKYSLVCMKNRQFQHQFLMLHCEAAHAQITQIFALCILMRTFKNSMTIKLVLLNVIRMLLRVLYYYPISTGRKEYHTVNPITFLCGFCKEEKGQTHYLSSSGKKEGNCHLCEFSASSVELERDIFVKASQLFQ